MKHRQMQILEQILRPILYDLAMMMRIPVIPRSNGNCAVPLALCSLTSMAYLGYLTAPEQMDGDLVGCILVFGYACCDMGAISAVEDDARKTIEGLVNGLIYRWVPRGGIGRHGSSAELFKFWCQDEPPALNADKLAELVMDGIHQLEGQLFENEALCIRIWQRIDEFSREGNK